MTKTEREDWKRRVLATLDQPRTADEIATALGGTKIPYFHLSSLRAEWDRWIAVRVPVACALRSLAREHAVYRTGNRYRVPRRSDPCPTCGRPFGEGK